MLTYKALTDEVAGLSDQKLRQELARAEREEKRAHAEKDESAEQVYSAYADLIQEEITAREEEDAEESEDDENTEDADEAE